VQKRRKGARGPFVWQAVKERTLSSSLFLPFVDAIIRFAPCSEVAERQQNYFIAATSKICRLIERRKKERSANERRAERDLRGGRKGRENVERLSRSACRVSPREINDLYTSRAFHESSARIAAVARTITKNPSSAEKFPPRMEGPRPSKRDAKLRNTL